MSGKYSIWINVFFLLGVLSSSAQVVSEDLVKMNNAYKKYSEISVDMIYNIYADHTTTTPYEVKKGVYRKKGNSYYSYIYGIKSIQNEAHFVVVDENNKVMVVKDPVSLEASNESLFNNVEIDALLSVCSSIDYKTNENQKIYTLNFDSSKYFECNAIELFINKDSYLLDKMVLYYRNAISFSDDGSEANKSTPRLEVHYKNVNTNPGFSSSRFSVSKYIRTVGGKLQCSTNYSEYRLFNQKQLTNKPGN